MRGVDVGRGSELEVKLSPGSRTPLYLQVVAAVVEAIGQERLRPGMALPSVRSLAGQLGVTVNTVLAALRELQAQGWLTSRERDGFFVAAGWEEPRPGPGGGAGAPGFDLPAHLQPVTSSADVVMDLSDGWADARLAPFQALGRAYQRGLKLHGASLMASREPLGLPRLRKALAGHLGSQRGLAVEPDQIIVLRGSSMAVTLVAQALVGGQGGTVAVEDPGHPGVRESLGQACTARLKGLPVDAGGVVVEALEALLAEGALKLLVLTPQCQFPTAVRLEGARRSRILELSRSHRFPILELDGEQDYLAAPEPMAALDPGQVLHFGSLSRSFAPGLGVGYLVAPASFAALLARARQRLDWQGDPATEWALSELFLDGEMGRQVLRVRKAARERMEALQDALAHGMAERLRWRTGGMALWVEGIGPLADPAAFHSWTRACQTQGLRLRPGRYYRLDGAETAATRMGFTGFTPEELQRAVAMMQW